jgi:hypothetical protein
LFAVDFTITTPEFLGLDEWPDVKLVDMQFRLMRKRYLIGESNALSRHYSSDLARGTFFLRSRENGSLSAIAIDLWATTGFCVWLGILLLVLH